MAIIPESQYPGKITPATSEYPYGSARNITVPGDGTGTPWEAAIVNDIFGFQQALLSDAGITPSGDPDTATVSQYLQAAKKAIAGSKIGFVADVSELLQIENPEDGAAYDTTGYHPGSTVGGGDYVWSATESKTNHDGGTILDPDKIFPADWSVTADVEAWFTAAASGTGCYVLKTESTVSASQFGVVPGAAYDQHAVVQAFWDAASGSDWAAVMDIGADVLVSDTCSTRSNTKIVWAGDGFLKLTQASTIGGVIATFDPLNSIAENIYLEGPRADGNNQGYPTGNSNGENGISGAKCNNVTVLGGVAKNCRLGAVQFGGKGFYWELGCDNVRVEGCVAVDCTYAMGGAGVEDSTGGGAYNDYRTASGVRYANFFARNCDRLMYFAQFNDPVLDDPDVNSFSVDGVMAINVGRESKGGGTELDYGPILIDRAANLSINGVRIYNQDAYGKVRAVIRCPTGRNVRVTDVEFVGEADAIVEHNAFPGAQTTGFDLENAEFQIRAKGAVALSVISLDSRAPNITNVFYDFVQDAPSGGIFSATTLSTTSAMVIRLTDRTRVLSGPVQSVRDTAGNNVPSRIQFVGPFAVNALEFSQNAFGQYIQGLTEDLTLIRSGVSRVRATDRGVAFPNIPTYADNAAAIGGGLQPGDIYKTASGELRIV